jgi:STE24 endopeptidase
MTISAMPIFTQLFLFMLILAFAIQWWLNQRQIKYVNQHKQQVPKEFSEKISLENHQKSADYTSTKMQFSQYELIFGNILLILWTLGGGLNWLDKQVLLLSFEPILTGIILILLFSVISTLLELPFSLYNTFVLEERFGFNRTNPKLFFTDMLKQFVLMMLIGFPLLYVILWLMQTAGDLWWLYAWSVWFSFSLLMMWAYPAFIAPLFNKFSELDSLDLKQRIENLMTRCGFTSSGILVMDGSKRSSHGNAYFTGLGKNKRIVFFDNLLNSLDDEEIEAVLAHELGHFKKKHILKRMLSMAFITLGGFAILGYLMQQQWFYSGLGVETSSIYMALILFSLTSAVFAFPFTPLSSAFSRKHEFEADDYASSQTNAQKLIDALVKLYKDNNSTLTPDPVFSAWYDSHPPASIRVENLRKNLIPA